MMVSPVTVRLRPSGTCLLVPSVILVTHTHTDHLDPRAIAALSTGEPS
jgi:L-ascorbate metabolism protein UlaG (beta-lactamase superfamily)